MFTFFPYVLCNFKVVKNKQLEVFGDFVCHENKHNIQ